MGEPLDARDGEFLRVLAEALEQIERGETPDLGQLCGGRARLVTEVEGALGRRDVLQGLHRAATTFDPSLGTTVAGRYALRTRLGAGSMGVVYAAEDRELPRTVAVKLLRPEWFAGSEVRARFTREAEVLASLQHPAVVSVIDRGVADDDRPYIVMELLRGATASELLEVREGELSASELTRTAWVAARIGADAALEPSYLRQAAVWIATVSRGLHVAHQAGVVHRDVKPSNVFLRSTGEAVLIDFGIVTLGAEATVLRRDQALGTPAYMAPEQLDPRGEMTAATDVYGLCATLYHLVTFRKPYEGTPSQVLAQLQKQEPPAARRVRADLPRDLQAVLDKGLARRPRDRYPTAAALADDLEAWLEFRSVAARPIGPAQRLWRRARRSTVARTLAAAAVVLAVALVVWSQWHAADAERTRQAFAAGFARIGPTTFLGQNGQRVPASKAAEAELRQALHTFVQLAKHPCPSRVLRAAFRMDRDDYAGAAADLAMVARATDSEVCRVLAERCRERAAGGAIEPALDLATLPEASSVAGGLTLALLWMRHPSRDRERAYELLRGIGDGVLGASELRLLVELEMALVSGDRRALLELAREVHDRAVRLEELRGGRSALTASCIGLALQLQARWLEAADAFVAGAALAGYDFLLWSNLAGARELTQDFVQARTSAERAIELEPSTRSAHKLLARVCVELGDYATADAVIRSAPFGDDPSGQRERAELVGQVHLARALLADDPSERTAWARSSAEALTGWDQLVAHALAEGAGDRFPTLVDGVLQRPLDWRRLRALAELIPTDPSPEEAEALRDLLLAIADALAPDYDYDNNR